MRALIALVLLSAPALADSVPSGVTEVVAAERAFAKRCGEVGLRASFLEFFGPDAVSFAPDPGPARERLERRPAPKEPPPVLLEWGPEQAEIAPAGDLGWTTGPTRLTDKTGKQPPHFGRYFSLWRRQPDGTWKVELDVGIDAPEAPIPAAASTVGARTRARDGGVDAIRRVDEAFCAAAGKGAGKAYLAALAANGRVHRQNIAPLVGEAAWRPWASALPGVMTCTPQAARSSSGLGLGYAYGSWERRDRPDGAVLEKGYYTRVWRHDGTWQIAVDIAKVTPAR